VSAPPPSLGVAIIARDEEALLPECLRSVGWADDVLVLVDAATSDKTREVAHAAGARVAERAFDSFARQRAAALELSTTDWLLFVDADERVSAALRDEVRATIEAPGTCVGFWVPRRNLLMGRVVRHAGWWPDYQLRLLKRGHAQFDAWRAVHEVARLDGPAGYLRHPLLHLNYRSLDEFVRKQERYSRLDAQRWLSAYGRPRLRALVGQPVREFWRRYVVLQGYREGLLGLVLSVLLAWYAGKAVWLAWRSASDSG
jgi:glycosyltransferase involved in cell wall biosynthesis